MSSLWLTRHIPGRVWLGLCVILVVAGSGADAVRAEDPKPANDAAPPPRELPALSWKAPPECPDEAAVRARVASLLGRDATSASEDASTRAQGAVTHGRTGYKLTLTVKSGNASGTRTLAGEDCAALSDTAAWLVAVTVDPNVPETPPAPPPPAAAPEPVPEPVVVAPPPPAPLPPVAAPVSLPSPWSLYGAGFVGIWQGESPSSVRAQPGAALGFGYRWLDTEFRAAFALPREREFAMVGRLRDRTQQYALMSCARFGGRLRAGPCMGAALAVTEATPRDAVGLQSQRGRWASLLFGAQVSYAILRYFELFAEGGLSVPQWRRPNFILTNETQQSAFHITEVGGYGRLGVRFRWALPPALLPAGQR